MRNKTQPREFGSQQDAAILLPGAACTVKKPESGLAQIVLAVLHTALLTVPVPFSVPELPLPGVGLLTVNVPDPPEIIENVPSLLGSFIPVTTMVSPSERSAPMVTV